MTIRTRSIQVSMVLFQHVSTSCVTPFPISAAIVVTPSQSLSEPELQNWQQQDPKVQSAILKSLLSIQYFIPLQPWVYNLGTASSSNPMNALHTWCEGKPSNVHWQQGQSWLL